MDKKGVKPGAYNFASIFGGVITSGLLILYALTTFIIVWHIIPCMGKPACSVTENDGTVYVFTTVGGLVSALVVAVLANTPPGHNPAEKLGNLGVPNVEESGKTLVGIYLGVWMLTGVTAVIVGVMLIPNASKTLSDMGTAWLGLAITAVYAYFGIQPSS